MLDVNANAKTTKTWMTCSDAGISGACAHSGSLPFCISFSAISPAGEMAFLQPVVWEGV